jgi:TonB family protein
MTDMWKQFEGQLVDDEFPLQQLLSGDDHCAVFLTQRGDSQPLKVAIKILPLDPATLDLQLSRWRLAAQLAHPNLLRLHDFGRCRLDDANFLYVVMEFAEEDLSQILPERALTAAETRDMLGPVLDVLVYLHSKGLVHGHIKPSNILATADQLKLSSDTLSSIAESHAPTARPSPYSAPEVTTSGLTPASDVWSLGITLVEVLTQRVPVLPPGVDSNFVLPDTFPQPFLDITRHALLREPRRRWTIAEIAARMNPTAVAAAAGHSQSSSTASPLAVPLSPVPAVPAAKLQSPRYEAPAPKASSSHQPSAAAQPKQTLVLPNYVVPVGVVLLVLVAIFALPKILGHRAESSSSTSSAASAPPASQPKPAVAQPEHRDAPPPARTAASNSAKLAAEKKPAPAATALRTDTFPSANAPAPASSSASPARGEVLDQVLPDVSEKARATIQGKVRVTVRVHVEPAGNVSSAELESPGPSKYFADLALQAVRRWEFTAPELNGHSAPSDWLIRFEFSQSGTQAFPKQTTP